MLFCNMEKYVTDIKDFVIQTLTNGSEKINRANSGDPMGCFQMGMIYLLGIDTSMDFKKATQFFSNQSLSDDNDAIRLLGFIAELEGNYSKAFQYYAQTESSEKESYLDRIIKGRNHIQDYLRKLDLPLTVNKEISSILNDYSKSKTSKTGASIKIAAICEDEQSCLEAAKNLFDAKDYISAIQWLKKGQISADNAIYMAINSAFEKSKTDLLKSKAFQIVDLKSSSLLSDEDIIPLLNKVKKSCDDSSKICSNEWKKKANSYVDVIIKKHKDNEHKAYLAALAEEEARKKKRNKLIKYGAITIGIIFLFIIIIPSSESESEKSSTNPQQDIENTVKDNSNVSHRTEATRKIEDSPKDEEAAIASEEPSDDSNSNNKYYHDFTSNTTMSHHLVGFFADRGGSYPVEIDFSNTGNNVSNVVYNNVKVGVRIPLICSEFNENKICFEGRDGNNDFVISLEKMNGNSFEGTAVVGNKEFLVELKAECSHGN